MRLFRSLLGLLAFLCLATCAQAETVTYTLALEAPSPFNALGGGTGTFTVALSPDQAANDALGFATPYFPGTGLQNFSVTIAGETYPTAPGANVYLLDGQVTELIFDSLNQTSSTIDDLFLDNGTFTLLRIENNGTPQETIESEEGAIVVTPEPQGWLLAGTGTLLVLPLVWRRLRESQTGSVR